MQIHTGVVTFRAAGSGDASRGNVVVLALFADNDPSAPANLDPQIQRIGAVYDLSVSSVRELKATDRLPVHELSAVNGHCLRFKYRATPVPSSRVAGQTVS